MSSTNNICKLYALSHLKIRNDEQCPNCRQYALSFHESNQEAYEMAGKDNLDDEELSIEDLRTLKSNDYLWVDEWVRRRNGDRYQVFPIVLDKKYKSLSDEYESISTDLEGNAGGRASGLPEYMLLHIKVDKDEWCPDNMIINVSMHLNQDTAFIASDLDHSFKSEFRGGKGIWIPIRTYDWYSDDEEDKPQGTIGDNTRKEHTDKDHGEFYKLIKIELNKPFYLNDYLD